MNKKRRERDKIVFPVFLLEASEYPSITNITARGSSSVQDLSQVH